MVIRSTAIALSLALLAWSHVARAQPAIGRPVTDAAGVLGEGTVAAIEARLHAHHEAGHAQIALLVVRSLEGAPITDYALRAAERWGGGRASRDDGALFVLAVDDREMRIEVGYGLEEAIPDSAAMRILDSLIPHLREQRFDLAAWTVADALVASTGGASEPFPESLAAATPASTGPATRSGRARRGSYQDTDWDGAPAVRDEWAARERAERAEDARATGVGLGLLAFVAFASLLVFVALWRESSAEYDHDGKRVARPLRAIWDDVLAALRSGGGGAGGGGAGRGGAGGGGSRLRHSYDPHPVHRHVDLHHRHATSSYDDHHRDRYDHHRDLGSSSSSSSKHRSYSGGGGNFGGGGASKRW